jgi:hypothetical protein
VELPPGLWSKSDKKRAAHSVNEQLANRLTTRVDPLEQTLESQVHTQANLTNSLICTWEIVDYVLGRRRPGDAIDF